LFVYLWHIRLIFINFIKEAYFHFYYEDVLKFSFGFAVYYLGKRSASTSVEDFADDVEDDDWKRPKKKFSSK